LLFGWPGLAPAFGGTPVTWLGGTLPYDTVPRLEADPKLLLRAGRGGPQLGAGLDVGLTDGWMLGGQWLSLPNQASQGLAELRVKLLPEPWRGLGLAAAWGWRLPEGAAARSQVTAIAAWEGFDLSVALNLAMDLETGTPRFSAAAWGPYLTYALRPGVEYLRGDGSGWGALLLQLGFNAPGDLSLDLGYRHGQDGDWAFLARLSFLLFPHPPKS
jgi:hypothetical protein